MKHLNGCNNRIELWRKMGVISLDDDDLITDGMYCLQGVFKGEVFWLEAGVMWSVGSRLDPVGRRGFRLEELSKVISPVRANYNFWPNLSESEF